MHHGRKTRLGSPAETAFHCSITFVLPNYGEFCANLISMIKFSLEYTLSHFIVICYRIVRLFGNADSIKYEFFWFILGSAILCHGIHQWRRPNVLDTTRG